MRLRVTITTSVASTPCNFVTQMPSPISNLLFARAHALERMGSVLPCDISLILFFIPVALFTVLQATKFSSIVQLLLGEIPERSVFRADGIRQSLVPYLHLTTAVRSGSVAEYEVRPRDPFRSPLC